jgi:hypothetical protein
MSVDMDQNPRVYRRLVVRHGQPVHGWRLLAVDADFAACVAGRTSDGCSIPAYRAGYSRAMKRRITSARTDARNKKPLIAKRPPL